MDINDKLLAQKENIDKSAAKIHKSFGERQHSVQFAGS